jgi:hypothetical protein
MREDGAYPFVRRFVSIDGANHGALTCSPLPANPYSLLELGSFTPDSPLCREIGAADTPLMVALNGGDETPGPTAWTTIVNADQSFVFIARRDGPFAPAPAEDREGRPHDFSGSGLLEGARNIELTGQAQYGDTAHAGIVNSPQTWLIALGALTTA